MSPVRCPVNTNTDEGGSSLFLCCGKLPQDVLSIAVTTSRGGGGRHDLSFLSARLLDFFAFLRLSFTSSSWGDGAVAPCGTTAAAVVGFATVKLPISASGESQEANLCSHVLSVVDVQLLSLNGKKRPLSVTVNRQTQTNHRHLVAACPLDSMSG